MHLTKPYRSDTLETAYRKNCPASDPCPAIDFLGRPIENDMRVPLQFVKLQLICSQEKYQPSKAKRKKRNLSHAAQNM